MAMMACDGLWRLWIIDDKNVYVMYLWFKRHIENNKLGDDFYKYVMLIDDNKSNNKNLLQIDDDLVMNE